MRILLLPLFLFSTISLFSQTYFFLDIPGGASYSVTDRQRPPMNITPAVNGKVNGFTYSSAEKSFYYSIIPVDQGDLPKIIKCDKEGNNVELLIEGGIEKPTEITLDEVNNKLYFWDFGDTTDGIYSINTDGTDLQFHFDLQDLFGVNDLLILPERNELYWVEFNSPFLRIGDLSNGNITTIDDPTGGNATLLGLDYNPKDSLFYYVSKKFVENAKLYKINLFEQNPTSEYVAGAGDSYVNSLLVDTMENRFLYATYPTPAIERTGPGTGSLPFYSPQTYLGGQIRELNEIAIDYDISNSIGNQSALDLDFKITSLGHGSFQIEVEDVGDYNVRVFDMSGKLKFENNFNHTTTIRLDNSNFEILNFVISNKMGIVGISRILID